MANSFEDKRIELDSRLRAILGSTNIYYQPPESIKMRYPAIVYKRDDIQNTHANNAVYKQSYIYQVTVITYDPDDVLIDKVSKVPTARFIRAFAADGLNHTIFNIYY